MNKPADLVPALDLGLTWRNRFATLGEEFFTPLQPTPLPAPYWVGRSRALGRGLGLPEGWADSQAALEAFTGNLPLAGSQPLASVYSGHQFGVWAGQLGDGRAILLGEIDSPAGALELQLKGSGLTPYSRMGDGRAVLRSSIREFLCSEAMHGLGIPTSRALCVTGSDAPVRREEIETAAVVTRVAPSFIRFGHFEHFAYRDDHAALRRLADHVIEHHYPGCDAAAARHAGNRYAALLEAVSARTADMVAQWQAVGFCHGVMNTDNMSILGLTIDYGPFQFLDAFDPGHICNHSDNSGRYAYNRQPNIAYWNLFCLGQALLPLIEDQALALAALEPYKALFPQALQQRMSAKLGLPEGDGHNHGTHDSDRLLIEDILKLLAAGRVDYTIFWRRLSEAAGGGAFEPVRDLFPDRAAFDAWLARWRERLGGASAEAEASERMLRTNPRFVLRNHLAELAIRQAKLKDMSGVQELQAVLENPFDAHPQHADWAGFPPDRASRIEISCSS